ncbi:MAG: glycosyltransferase family 4 protein [Cytophagales bacterium]|nr:glycosyltransferase family 4 protein [Cytophagales bacterium]
MKITICTKDAKDLFGGAFVWLIPFVTELRKKGVDVSLVFFLDHDYDHCPTIQDLQNKGFTCHYQKWLSKTYYTSNTEDRVKWILKKVKQEKPDIFLVNTVVPGFYASRWIREWGILTVGIIHSDHQFYDALVREFGNRDSKFCLDAFIAVSSYLKEKIKKSDASCNVPVSVIACGTASSGLIANFKNRPFSIAYAGRLETEAKRILETVKAFCVAVKEVAGIQFEIYGDGSERERAQEIIESNGASDKVLLKGVLPTHELRKALADCQAFTLLSDYEGLPVALMEAMEVGLVPICKEIDSGIPDLVKQGSTGFLVKNREDSFLEALKELTSNRELWAMMSNNARKLIVKDYLVDSITQKYLDLFHNLKMEFTPTAEKVIPKRIKLPAINKHFVSGDNRKPTLGIFVLSILRRLLNRLRIVAMTNS